MIVHVLIQNMGLHVCIYSNSSYIRMYVEGSRVFLNHMHTWFLINSYTMGTSGLLDIYTRGPQARGLRMYISGEPRVPMVQLLCNTSVHEPCIGER